MRICAVVGLGYVGLNLAVALGKQQRVLGYDLNEQRINELRQCNDVNHHVSQSVLKNTSVLYTHDIHDIKDANFYIITVSTPALFYEFPDLSPLISAVEHLAPLIKKNDIIVFESTVYPGTTEEICIPILEHGSQLICGKDFNVGYSPERINPGDKRHTLKNITKIISAQNKKTLTNIKSVYASICDTIYPVSSIPIAEATKLLENTQRDINIAFMNEFAKIAHALALDTDEIMKGAETKWGFMPYKPGFVGGHCISIDPHYLAFKAKLRGLYPELVLTARKVNSGMTEFVIQAMLKLLAKHKMDLSALKVGILGASYKANTNDLRNSLSLKLLKELKEYGIPCCIHDPLEQKHGGHHSFKILTNLESLEEPTVLILTVPHEAYKKMGLKQLLKHCGQPQILMDIPHLFVKEGKNTKQLIYWSL